MTKEATEEALNQILVAIVEAKDFVIEQAPPVVSELLKYEMVESLLAIALSFLLIGILFLSTFKWCDQERDEWDDWKKQKGVVFFLFITSAIILTFVVILSFCKILKILIAPKVFIIEYVAALN